MKIYDPKSDYDVLAGIKLSNKNLELINEKWNKFLFAKKYIDKLFCIVYNRAQKTAPLVAIKKDSARRKDLRF